MKKYKRIKNVFVEVENGVQAQELIEVVEWYQL